MPKKAKVLAVVMTMLFVVPIIVVVQRWEERRSQEQIAFRVGALEAFDNQEYDVAASRFAVMASGGIAIAQRNLAFLYERGLGVEQNLATAMQWYRAAADQGDRDSKLALAQLLEEGAALQDRALALSLYQELATTGSTKAAIRLASLHFRGVGTAQDYVAAAQWFVRAAKAGNPEAQLQLGLLYRDGFGVPQDIVFAHMWLNLAAARFSAAESHRREEALAARDALLTQMRDYEVRESLESARQWQSANS